MPKKKITDSGTIIEKHLPKFDKAIVNELKQLLGTPAPKEEMKGQVEEFIGKSLTDTQFNKLYRYLYSELQKVFANKTDIVKELLKYRVAKTPKTVDAIHFYLHPDVLGDYKSEQWIEGSKTKDYSVESEDRV